MQVKFEARAHHRQYRASPSSSVIPHFRSLAGIVICRELTLQSTANVRADTR